MTKRMLIDAAHADEMRVVLMDGDQVYDYDFVTSAKSQVKGNIYLAKITRVEPSLQAAFVEYGGGKQGFLPFSEIHPDYYQLPQADKQKLLEEQIAEAEAEEAAEDEAFEREQAEREAGRHVRREGADGFDDQDDSQEDDSHEPDLSHDAEALVALAAESGEASGTDSLVMASLPALPAAEPLADDHAPIAAEIAALSVEGFAVSSAPVEDSAEAEDAAADAQDESADSRANSAQGRGVSRRYRIQEVIKRNQIVLVQVIKEERGNKGASLTTFISLAGRCAVLMPNSPRGGGISRKITDREMRKRLKEIASEMRTHRGMSVIIRTAGIDRTKAEIRRDYEYLASVWNQVRETTLASSAPVLIYEEANLVKRALRDLYTSDIEEVIIEGEEAFQDAKNFMRMLMPGHIGRIKLYQESMPLYSYAGVEEQLASMVEPQVRLPSGGYLVINPTEALISVDVNSGRSTTERNVEETAIKTNLEAAHELARQLRVRDLAGLIVVDFIDMNFGKNRKLVERAMKDALKPDRAKVQVGRISMFGLMELSRQRLRPSISEAMGITCPHCKGTGHIQSVETVGIQIIRAIEKEAASGEFTRLRVATLPDAASYLLNDKRSLLLSLEERYRLQIVIEADATLLNGNFRLYKTTHEGRELQHEPSARRSPPRPRRGRRGNGRDFAPSHLSFADAVSHDLTPEEEALIAEARQQEEAEGLHAPQSGGAQDEDGDYRSRRGGRNRRGRRGGGREGREPLAADGAAEETPEYASEPGDDDVAGEGLGANDSAGRGRPERGRRRGRRGGRNRRGNGRMDSPAADAAPGESAGDSFAPRVEAPVTRAPEPVYYPTSAAPAPAAPAVVALPAAQTNPTAYASPIISESSGDAAKNKRKGWWSRVLEN